MKLTELFDNVPDIEIKNLMSDSRKKKPDSIFFCEKGMMFDGHRFVDQAISNRIIERKINEDKSRFKTFYFFGFILYNRTNQNIFNYYDVLCHT